MLLTMGVSLYTVRVVLKTMGVVDYGIYNVVGSIVTMFSFLSNTMSSASQRFFAFEIGQGNRDQLKRTFSTTMTIYLLIALVILLFAETVGLWFLNNKLAIPADRMEAAHWVYQFSILSLMMTMFTVPYNAAIIAHENMKVYAYVSIIEVLLKLAIVYLLVLFSFDKLELYGILTFSVTCIVTLIYRTYCQRRFEECRFLFYWDKQLFNKILSYSGWNLFGALSSVGKNHGVNILINIFFGPAVNAARGVAYQVQSVVLNFGNNFFTAVRPQIIKSYASDKHEEMTQLVFQSTKFSFYLLFLLSLPILLEARFVLGLWLEEVPAYSVTFIRLIVIDTLLELLVNPIVTLNQATGKVKWYQIVVGGTRLLCLPIAYLFLRLGFGAEIVFYILISNTVVCNMLRVIMIKRAVEFSIANYVREVVLVLALVSIISYIIPKLIQEYLIGRSPIESLLMLFISSSCCMLTIAVFGLRKEERTYVISIVSTKLRKRTKVLV
ncbi:lipopolysaccharide biosynthesis protein [Dyadobacter luticola]|uniref:Lipopolysaccharide biosynthesis protein n=2 Tax=Dyadobacter luticola TaxID=1979387 RepID=A0A5R9L620_9BACT|nr:lipopolysaccharide biosynthesis protein [Dyadobacter luticola]